MTDKAHNSAAANKKEALLSRDSGENSLVAQGQRELEGIREREECWEATSQRLEGDRGQ